MKQTFTRQEIEQLVFYAAKAPSGGNQQPWNVIVKNNECIVTLRENAIGSMLDGKYFASYVALGCFIENFEIAAKSFGLQLNKEIQQQSYLEIHYTLEKRISGHKHKLFDAITKRRTNRNLWNERVIPQQQIQALRTVVEYEKGYSLSCISENHKKKEIALTLGIADQIRYLHPQLFTEMMKEFCFTEEEEIQRKEGLGLHTLALPGNMKDLLLLLKHYPYILHELPKELFQTMISPLLIGSSHLCCLSTNHPITEIQMVKTGQILQHVWLEATQRQLHIQPWSIMSFFLLRIDYMDAQGFSSEEKQLLLQAKQELNSQFSLRNSQPLFFFRLFQGKDAAVQSLKMTPEEVIEYRDN